MLALESEQAGMLHQTKAESMVILEQARDDAERRKRELLEGAKQEVSRLVEQGKVQLTAEKNQMIRDAKQEIVEIAIAAATKILKESVDEKRSQKLAQAVVDELS